MQEISLNLNTFSLFPSVYAVQNDTGRELKMTLTDRTLVATDTAAVAINRSDGSYYTITGTVDTATNSVTADITQALTQPGRTLCQLKITDTNDEIVSSYTFCIMVQPSTDGISEEQLGYSVQDLMDAAQTIISGGFSPEVKAALLLIASKVAYIDGNGQDYYDALDAALNPPANLVSISAVYTQSGTVYDTDTLDSLKTNLVVTAYYSNSTSETINNYTLSGSLTAGTSTITVSYGGKTDTFNVTVTHSALIYSLYNATFTGNNDAIDTEISLFDTNKDFSIMFDLTIETKIGSSLNWAIFAIGNGDDGNFYFRKSTSNGNLRFNDKYATTSEFGYNYVGRFRAVFTHAAGTNIINAQYKAGTSTPTTASVTATSFVTYNNHLYVGGDGSSYHFNRTITSFEVFDDVRSAQDILDFFADEGA